jgi:glycosyltransferase involved in cell wall biosynthesis
MNDVLLTVSGRIEPEIEAKIARGERPRADYLAMARAFRADLLDYEGARRTTGRMGWLLEKVGGPNLMLAWACFRQRKRYRVIFSDGEQVGIPLALLLKFVGFGRRPRHLMIAHILSVGKKILFFDWLGLHTHIDRFFVYSTWQKRFIEERWGVAGERVVFTPFMVDARFFAPGQETGTQVVPELANHGRSMICAVGLECRDYPTLMAAVRGLEVDVVVAAASPWSKRPDSTEGQEIPENVLVRRFSQHQLRDLYAASRFVVMPLDDVNFQAGVTAILEGMAMGKAMVCTCTPGQTDVIVEGETGRYVPPKDVAALREVIESLLDNVEEAERLGRNGRRRVEEEMSLDCYVERLSEHVREGREALCET